MTRAVSDTPRPENVEDVCNPYNSDTSPGRRGIMVSGDWHDDIDDYIESVDAKALYINASKGWKGRDFSFLAGLTTIEELNIIASKCEHLEAIEQMERLQSLSLTCDTKSTVDFSRLPRLADCYLLWWPGAASIFDATTLGQLYLDGVKLRDFSPLANLGSLRHLTIANSTIDDLAPLAKLEGLERLELIDCRKLGDFDAIGRLTALRRLTIRGSKSLHDLDFLRGLGKLEVLVLSDNGSLDSLAPVADLRRLKALAFAGDSNVADGDLSVLEGLPKLSMLMFASRRHYSHKLIKPWNWNNFDRPDRLLAGKAGARKRVGNQRA